MILTVFFFLSFHPTIRSDSKNAHFWNTATPSSSKFNGTFLVYSSGHNGLLCVFQRTRPSTILQLENNSFLLIRQNKVHKTEVFTTTALLLFHLTTNYRRNYCNSSYFCEVTHYRTGHLPHRPITHSGFLPIHLSQAFYDSLY